MIRHHKSVGVFNARWLKPQDVARTFVPVPQFRQLTHDGHSLLLGPRGCGKTTLLKMLTEPALSYWRQSGRHGKFNEPFSFPSFEAVYIPADVRWSYELSSLADEAALDAGLVAKTQQLMVATNALVQILAVAEHLVGEEREVEAAIAERLIRNWALKQTLNDFRDVCATLRHFASAARGYLRHSDTKSLVELLKTVHPSFFGHALDAPIDAIDIISANLPFPKRPKNWALCFDELEIAPEWLREELLTALRSVAQHIFLKLTWSPLLPSGLRSSPESAADFKAIRLWHSHLMDPKVFCEELTVEFLADRLTAEGRVSPLQFFNRSILAAESTEEFPDSYERGSTEYEVFKTLASWDQSLRSQMQSRGIDPTDPVPASSEQKDQFFRKLKPVALLRSEFMESGRARSRKAVTLYSGREAVYAMSEGNPRWLLGLLNDFVDLRGAVELGDSGPLEYADQARILGNFARRFLSQIKATPFRPKIDDSCSAAYALFDIVNRVGSFFQRILYSREFPLDPVGSFRVEMDCEEALVEVIEQLLGIGALVYVGSSPQDVPVRIRGARFRLSYMLAPVFHLPLRLYRETTLKEALRGEKDGAQTYLQF